MVEVRIVLDSDVHKNWNYVKGDATWHKVLRRGIQSLSFNDEEWVKLTGKK